MPVPEGFKEWTDARGRRRITWPGRKGFPVMPRKDETSEQAYLRTIAKDAEKAAQQAVTDVTGADASSPAGTDAAGAGAPPTDGEVRARPKGSDPKPKGGRPMGKPRPTDRDILEVWEELLVLPAIPFGLPVHDPGLDQIIQTPDGPQLLPGFRPRCEFCRDHFIEQGPKSAAELVTLSQQSEPMRRVLEQVTMAWKMISVAGTLGTYVMKPMLHHLAPAPVLDGVGPVLGVPPRPIVHPEHEHAHGPTSAAPAAAAPA